MLRKSATFVIIFSILFVNLYSFTVFAAVPDFPKSSTFSAVLFEATKGQLLYTKDMDKKVNLSLASQIMTVLIAIEKGNLDTKVTISKDTQQNDNTSITVEAGEKHSVEDLLYAVMLVGAKDAANALAEYVAGDNQKFVQIMNDKAKTLGMKSTVFLNPSGTLSDGQYTTARDLSILMKAALTYPAFKSVFSTSSKPWFSKNTSQVLANQNKLFWWGYEGFDGGKLGSSTNSRVNLISSVTRENMKLICIVLDSKSDVIYTESLKLLDYGFENFKNTILISKDTIIKTTEIERKQINLASLEDVYYTHPSGSNFIKGVDIQLNQNIKLPITKDLILGVAKYALEDGTVIDINLHSLNEIYSDKKIISTLKTTLKDNKVILYVLIFLSIIELIIIWYHVSRFILKRIKR